MQPARLAQLALACLLALCLAAGCAKKNTAPETPATQAAAPAKTAAPAPAAAPAPVPTPGGLENVPPSDAAGGKTFFTDEELASEYVADEDGTEKPVAPPVGDPIESFNRAMFAVNDKLYIYVLDPVADFWQTVIWSNLRVGTRNFFYNLRFPQRFVNNLLQGKLLGAGQETGRFLLNTLFGFGGLLEPSQKFGEDLNPPPEDLGQTFASWGIGDGFYIVWPVLGPSTARDTVGSVGDGFLDPVYYVNPWYAAAGIKAGEKINTGSFYVGEYERLKAQAVDPYEAFKDAYTQNRASQIAR